MTVLGFVLSYLLFGVTIVNSSNQKLLQNLIIRNAQKLTYTTDICLINTSNTTLNLVRYLTEVKLLATFAHLTAKSTNRRLKCSVFLLSEVLCDFNRQFANVLHKLFLSDSWNPSALFVFICDSKSKSDTMQIYSRFVEKYGLRRSVLNTASHLASYNVFSKLISTHNTSDNFSTFSTRPLTNAHGYELRPIDNAIYPYMGRFSGVQKGPFVNFLNVLSTFSNITIAWISHSVGIDAPNYSAMLQSNQANIAFFRSVKAPHTSLVAIQEQYTTCLCIFERPIENYFSLLLNPFSGMVWVLIAALGLVCLLLGLIYQEQFPRNLLLSTFFGLPVPCYQLTRVERFVMHVLNLLLLLLSSAYLTKLLEIMCSYKYEPQIQTIQEFEHSGLEVYAQNGDELARIKSIYPSWSARVRRIKDPLPKNAATTTRCMVAHFVEQSFLNVVPGTGLRRLYAMPEPLFWDPIVHSFAKGNPLVERFVQVWDRMYEAGVWNRWVQHERTRYFRINRFLPEALLRFQVLISMWWILVYGHCVSVIVLVGEIIYDRYFERKLRYRIGWKD